MCLLAIVAGATRTRTLFPNRLGPGRSGNGTRSRINCLSPAARPDEWQWARNADLILPEFTNGSRTIPYTHLLQRDSGEIFLPPPARLTYANDLAHLAE
jgi:hypothetical protein